MSKVKKWFEEKIIDAFKALTPSQKEKVLFELHEINEQSKVIPKGQQELPLEVEQVR